MGSVAKPMNSETVSGSLREAAAAFHARCRRGALQRALAVQLGVTLLVLAPVAGCGLRTNPAPPSSVIPANQDVTAWFRESALVVSWGAPDPQVVRRWGEVSLYTLYDRVHPLGCPACPPLSSNQVTLRPDTPGLTREGLRMYYEWVPEGAPGVRQIQIKTRFRSGENSPSTPVMVSGLAQAPKPELKVEVLPGGRQVRLYWPAYRDRIVHIITASGGQVESAVFFRTNVYMRNSPALFPMTPLNLVPVGDLQFLVPLRGAANEPVEFTLRLVDQFGNEGPASLPVSPPGRGGA